MGPKKAIYNRPQIHLVGGTDSYVRLILDRKCTSLADVDWRAGRLKEFIDSHPERVPRDVAHLCKQIGLSLSGRQARRLFKNSTGIGIRSYSINIRLAAAAEQLRVTNVPIKVVAAEAGYQNSRHFARRFKEMFHVKPMEFRKVWGRRNLAA
jgi:transcriptional regulator GlxA family with amidase domain